MRRSACENSQERHTSHKSRRSPVQSPGTLYCPVTLLPCGACEAPAIAGGIRHKLMAASATTSFNFIVNLRLVGYALMSGLSHGLDERCVNGAYFSPNLTAI